MSRTGGAALVLVGGLLAGSAAGGAELPRLAGMVVAPSHRVALFDAGSGLVTQAAEGDRVGDYTVRAIGPLGVRLERDGNSLMLLPVPSGAAPVAAPVDSGGVTFGLVLHPRGPADD
ncbi:MAG: hypothetical protein NVSMB18_36310 [Acetobacteraceae bacterium]